MKLMLILLFIITTLSVLPVFKQDKPKRDYGKDWKIWMAALDAVINEAESTAIPFYIDSDSTWSKERP